MESERCTMRGERGALGPSIHMLDVRQPTGQEPHAEEILIFGIMPNGDYVCLLELIRGTKDEAETVFYGDKA